MGGCDLKGRQPHQAPVPWDDAHTQWPVARARHRSCLRNLGQERDADLKKTKGLAGIDQLTPSFFAPRPGLEPGTYGLTERSTRPLGRAQADET